MRILVFAPHPDDEVLGCGGTIAKYAAQGAEVTVCIVTSALPPLYDNSEAVKNGWPHMIYPEIMQAHKLLGVKETVFLQLPTVQLETVPRYELNGKIAEVVQRVKPDTVYIPHFGDMQRDHGLTAESVMVAVRPKGEHIVRWVYAYETLSETEWQVPHGAYAFMPNTYVDIGAYLEPKKTALRCFRSQVGEFPDPRSEDAVEALAKLRGATMGAKAAEAFVLIREYRR